MFYQPSYQVALFGTPQDILLCFTSLTSRDGRSPPAHFTALILLTAPLPSVLAIHIIFFIFFNRPESKAYSRFHCILFTLDKVMFFDVLVLETLLSILQFLLVLISSYIYFLTFYLRINFSIYFFDNVLFGKPQRLM